MKAPKEYYKLTPDQKADLLNGCGPKGWGWIVPDRFILIGVNFHEACQVHDFFYQTGLPKIEADNVFLENMQEASESAYTGCRWIAYRFAFLYYLAVKIGGAGAYNRAKKRRLVMDFINYELSDWALLVTSLITVASVVVKATPTEVDNKLFAIFLRVMEELALNNKPSKLKEKK